MLLALSDELADVDVVPLLVELDGRLHEVVLDRLELVKLIAGLLNQLFLVTGFLEPLTVHGEAELDHLIEVWLLLLHCVDVDLQGAELVIDHGHELRVFGSRVRIILLQ